MTTALTIPFSTRTVTYECAGGETLFDVPFPVLESGSAGLYDVAVYQRRAGVETELTAVTDFTVSDLGEQAGALVTLATAVEADDVITIDGDRVPARITNFEQHRSLTTTQLNDELNRMAVLLQETKRSFGRALQRQATALPGDGGWDMGGYQIVNVADGTADTDAVTFQQLQAALGAFDETTLTAIQNLAEFLSAYAPLASPHFTGLPTAPTAEVGTTTTQVATTAFARAEAAAAAAEALADLAASEILNDSDVTGATVDLALDNIEARLDLLEAVPYPAKTQRPTLIDCTALTLIGNMTAGGGLAGLFDALMTTTSRKESTTGWCGVDFGSGNTEKILAVGMVSSSNGFDGSGGGADVRIRIYGSNTLPTTGLEGTLLFDSGTYADGEEFNELLCTSADQATGFRYVTAHFVTTVWSNAVAMRIYRMPEPVTIDCPALNVVRSCAYEAPLAASIAELVGFRTAIEVTEAGMLDVTARLEAQHQGDLVNPAYTDVLGFASRIYYRYGTTLSNMRGAGWYTMSNAVSGCNIYNKTDHYGQNHLNLSLDAVVGFYEFTLWSSAHTSSDTRDGLAWTNGGTTAYNDLTVRYRRGGGVVRS